MDSLQQLKCKKLADEIADEITLTPLLYNAIKDTEREIFVPINAHAYSLDAQPIDANQWISSPLTVVKMTMALECENVDNILEVGCGSGYQSAILSKLGHRIFSIERIQKLANEAKKRFDILNIKNVHVRFDDGNNGWKAYAPYDRILLSAATASVPERLFEQLKVGGILVAPIEKNSKQYITKFIKHGEKAIEVLQSDECLFVPLLNNVQSL
ncbi:protein-L-isoaspartate(D-aspartate) O-methyltransferase [Campylobacter pinnipediorum]|uniref:protein-L-isoaspartate(D-aspartate) O-methyltransferase n=1 Tax=Campylobacter pinnipediorum TaxID=1965231 RepID=UPI00084DF4CF|nr:protein-L-isoaspartate(D-aspartate) O-methyltransferase [Campylobacter pinnipediorum]